MIIASALPTFEQGIVEDNGNVACWVVLESNTPNESGHRMHFYQCLTMNEGAPIKRSGYCTKASDAKRSEIRQCKKLLDDVHPSEILNPDA